MPWKVFLEIWNNLAVQHCPAIASLKSGEDCFSRILLLLQIYFEIVILIHFL